MIRECFHFVNLFNTLNKLMQENMLRQEYVAVAPMTKLSAVNSGGSPRMQAGKSLMGMLLTMKLNYLKNITNNRQDKILRIL